jgi:hypothetical protein
MTPLQSTLIGGFLNFAGPITLLALCFWINSLRSVLAPWPRHFLPEWRTWLAALIGATVVFGSTAIDFKVLSDETNLLSVANMLTVFGKASNTEMWQYYYHTYHATDVSVPSRPILFPLFTSLVQHVVGVKWWAPFVVNFASLVILFQLVLLWAQRELPERFLPKSTTLLAILMSPVLSIVSTSAGYDLVSLTVGFAAFLLLFEYGRRQDSATLECLLFALVCYASVRYESIMAIPFTAAGLFFLEGKGIFKKVSLQTIAMAGLMILPLVVQRYLTWGSFENPPDRAPFSFKNAMDWSPIFFRSFFTDGNGPYPILLHWLGLGGLLLAVKRMRGVGMIPLVFLGFVLTLLISHHFGRADHPTQVRLFLPISFALSLLALYVLRDLERWADPRYLLMVFAVLVVHHRQYAVHDPLTAQLTMTREVRHIRDFISADLKPGDIFVYDRPGQLTALGLSAISWSKFKDERRSYLDNVRAHLYNRLILIDRPLYKPKNADDWKLEQKGYVLRPVRTHELTPEEYLRISVAEVGVEPPEAAKAAEPGVVMATKASAGSSASSTAPKAKKNPLPRE